MTNEEFMHAEMAFESAVELFKSQCNNFDAIAEERIDDVLYRQELDLSKRYKPKAKLAELQKKKELSNKEIENVDSELEKEFSPHGWGMPWENFLVAVRAILKKAQEK